MWNTWLANSRSVLCRFQVFLLLIRPLFNLPFCLHLIMVIVLYASPSTLKPLDSVYYSALSFITGDKFFTHRCILYEKVAGYSLADRMELHYTLFINLYCKNCKTIYASWSQDILTLSKENLENSFFSQMEKVTNVLKLKSLISFEDFKVLHSSTLNATCNSFSLCVTFLCLCICSYCICFLVHRSLKR